jgi:adenosylcobyric acid synthase
MTARALMIQGTGSDVGKSLLVAGLCRLGRRRGMKVAPFKPQNMSNNAAATADGGEIGRAQALQARAAGLEPHTDFNPVLLKPSSDRRAQVVVHGRVQSADEAATYMRRRGGLMPAVAASFARLTDVFDLVIVEGAGSPAEINLRAGDIANMGFARLFEVPVILAGDIDRGGVIAALVGTQAVLDPDDATAIVGFIVNRFRGDPTLFNPGLAEIEQRTGWPALGVVPWIPAAARLPQEDAVVLERPGVDPGARGPVRIAAPMLPRIANFDDADPLRLEPGVAFRFVPPGQPIPRDTDVVLLLGTKSTLADLAFLRAQGWDVDILAHVRANGHVLGLCGGMQMLGRRVRDPDGVDGAAGEADGLGLLDIETVMGAEKQVRPVDGACARSGAPVRGYEIHAGLTAGPALAWPMLRLEHGPDGAVSHGGRVEGTYLHGLFASDPFRRAWIERKRPGAASELAYEEEVEAALDSVADSLEAALDVDRLFALARRPRVGPACPPA